MQPAIEARAVTNRTRAGEVTVRDVSLTVGPGELAAIIGGSGSGKTTLLETLSGARTPTSGTVLRHPDRACGYVPAGDSIDPALPLGRALGYTAALRGVSGSGAGPVGEALDMTGLAAAASVPVGALNPGKRKCAEIAAELLAAPAAMFLDEPAVALDQAQATYVLRLLRSLCDTGITVLLTTTSPLQAARCDKVAVLAFGGHLAFFGTPAGACSYFGADSLEEIYERLSGLSDPGVAWSRRFLYFPRTAAGSAPVPTTPRAPGPACLSPDQAGPRSAGRPTPLSARDLAPGGGSATGAGDEREHVPAPGSPAGDAPVPGQGRVTETASGHSAEAGDETAAPEDETAHPADESEDTLPAGPPAGVPGPREPARPATSVRPARQLSVLARRGAEVLARSRRQQVTLAVAPVSVPVVFCVLLGVGALDGPAAVPLAWATVGALVTGAACELPMRAREAGVLRRERFAGLSVPAFLAAKAALLLPVLALACLLILAVPAAANRLQAGFWVSYGMVFAASVTGLAAATATLFRGQHSRRLPALHGQRP